MPPRTIIGNYNGNGFVFSSSEYGKVQDIEPEVEQPCFWRFHCTRCNNRVWRSGNCTSTTKLECWSCRSNILPYKKIGLTPYQGRKRSFGFFQCPKCMHRWTSAYSWANKGQACKICDSSKFIYPYCQMPLQKMNNNEGKKAHLQEHCEKCVSLKKAGCNYSCKEWANKDLGDSLNKEVKTDREVVQKQNAISPGINISNLVLSDSVGRGDTARINKEFDSNLTMEDN